MFERFTREARHVVVAAEAEARALGSSAIEPEHLLLALTRLDQTTPAGEAMANTLVPRAVAALKEKLPELGVMTDVALDPYTSHGQDGLIDEHGYVLNDETVEVLVRQALTQLAENAQSAVAAVEHADGRGVRERLARWVRHLGMK